MPLMHSVLMTWKLDHHMGPRFGLDRVGDVFAAVRGATVPGPSVSGGAEATLKDCWTEAKLSFQLVVSLATVP